MRTILVASGTSQNKLNFAIDFIETYLKEQAIEVKVVGASIYEVTLDEISPVLIVAIGPHSFGEKLPIVNGTAFITKIGMEQCCDEMINYLN